MKKLLRTCQYQVECDFCDILLNSEKEMKLHLKSNHTHREAKFKCEDCDFYAENELSIEVHQGRCHTESFECGLCDFKAESLGNLNIHLSTCESYECDYCFFRVKHLPAIKVHMEEEHEEENIKILHGKLDRKNEHLIKVTEHLRFDLFA